MVQLALVMLCFAVESVCRLLHLGYPYNWPLMFPSPSFMDFRWYFQHFQTLHTQAFFEGPDIIMYPAPVVLCYWFFYSFQPVATLVFLTCLVLSTLTAAAITARALVREGLTRQHAALLLGGAYLFSYPLWFEFKQANMEIVVWIILSFGLFSLVRRHTWMAAVLSALPPP